MCPFDLERFPFESLLRTIIRIRLFELNMNTMAFVGLFLLHVTHSRGQLSIQYHHFLVLVHIRPFLHHRYELKNSSKITIDGITLVTHDIFDSDVSW